MSKLKVPFCWQTAAELGLSDGCPMARLLDAGNKGAPGAEAIYKAFDVGYSRDEEGGRFVVWRPQRIVFDRPAPARRDGPAAPPTADAAMDTDAVPGPARPRRPARRRRLCCSSRRRLKAAAKRVRREPRGPLQPGPRPPAAPLPAAGPDPAAAILGINGVSELFVLDRTGTRVGGYEDSVFLKTRVDRYRVTPTLIPAAATLLEMMQSPEGCTPPR